MNARPKTPSPRPGFYKVPRRFDLATVLAVTFVYAAFFGIMNAYGVPIVVTGTIIAFLTVVGVIQMIVPERMVRFASIASGWIAFTIGYGVQIALTGFQPTNAMLFAMGLSILLFGALIGYIAGTVVAGVFLVADYVRKAVRRMV